MAVVAAPTFGRWTIAVDGEVWRTTFGDAVLAPVFSPDGSKVAAAVKDNNRWTIAVDGEPWPEDFDMVWDPIFSPDNEIVVAQAIQGKEYFLAVNGRVATLGCSHIFDPIFSPDGVVTVSAAWHMRTGTINMLAAAKRMVIRWIFNVSSSPSRC